MRINPIRVCRKPLVGIFLVLIFASLSQAVEWEGKFGAGLRGPLWAPMAKGSDFQYDGRSYEPFMMGWNGVLDLKY